MNKQIDNNAATTAVDNILVRERKKIDREVGCSMALSHALRVFINNYVAMRGYAKRTGETYEWAVGTLIKFVGDVELESITIDTLRKWRAHIDSRLSKNGVNICCYRMRMFIRYWNKRSKLNIDLDEFLIPKKESKLPNYLTEKQLRRVYRYCEGAKEKMIVSLLYSSGIRVSELCNVRVDDIQGDTILIRGKCGKERQVFITKDCMRNINNYLDFRYSNSVYLFDSSRGCHLRRGAIERIVKDIGKRAGLSKPLTPHVFRHTYATMLLSNGANLRVVQSMLGHADISTTQIYTHVNNTELKSSYIKHQIQLA